MADLFGTAGGASPLFNAPYKVPGVIRIEWDALRLTPENNEESMELSLPGQPLLERSEAVFDFLLQAINFEIPERVQITHGFSDSLQVYSFGQGTKTVAITGLIPYTLANHEHGSVEFFRQWNDAFRARKTVEKQRPSISISLDGLVLGILPITCDFNRSTGNEAVGTLSINGVIITFSTN